MSDVTAEPNPVTLGDGTTLTAGADDTATGGSIITGATSSIDGGAATPMAAVDGAFDSPSEELSGAIDASALDQTGDHQLCVVATDGEANTSGATCTTLTVVAANATPVALPQNVEVVQDTPALITLTGADADPDDVLGFAIVDLPTNGSLFAGDSTDEADRISAAGALAGDQVTYVPVAGYTGPDSFTFTAGDGSATSAPAEVSITVVSDALHIDDSVVTNGQRTKASGTLSCDTGDVFVLDVVLTQVDGAVAEGKIRGVCTGDEQDYQLAALTTAGSTLAFGTAELCARLRSAEPGARVAEETVETCRTVGVFGSRADI